MSSAAMQAKYQRRMQGKWYCFGARAQETGHMWVLGNSVPSVGADQQLSIGVRDNHYPFESHDRTCCNTISSSGQTRKDDGKG